jgi:prepilin-type N-terminal cleavage/methylation domain-containing protein
MRHRRAFTLVEVLIVVVIIGIAAAIIVPQISHRDDLKAAAAARVVVGDLLYAQNLAITRQEAHYLVFNVSNQTYQLVKASAMTAPLTHPVTRQPYVEKFGAVGGTAGLRTATLLSATFAGSGSPTTTVGFDELGTPVVPGSGGDEALSTGAIQLQSGSFKLQVTLEPYTGQVKVTALE